MLIWIILFRLNFNISSIHRVREINFIPFYYEDVYEGDFPLFEAFLNVLIFIPFGIYLNMLNADNKKIILGGFLTSLFFEISQYIFKLGATDITDLITNTIGCIIGIYLLSLIYKIFKNHDKVEKIIKIITTIFTIISFLFFVIISI